MTTDPASPLPSDDVVPEHTPADAASTALVAAARGGDRRALERLWESHRRYVVAVLLAHKPARADVDDLLQEVASTMCSKLGQLQEDASILGWLRVVAVNVARLAGRRAELVGRHLPPAADHAARAAGPDAGNPADGVAGRDESGGILALAQSLPEDYREPLLLRSLQDLSYRQIAAAMNLPETTVETRIVRARRMLRDLVQQREQAAAARRAAAAGPPDFRAVAAVAAEPLAPAAPFRTSDPRVTEPRRRRIEGV